ncbi:hypothetical protein SCD_n00110 [Sulfuricella denitrificans skB26]|uniref:Uncharacterized protein n=1 Tax=Sulfuricella denitrificans (strain DSM 22764 / NBRC 105220 / skB26) TaxID=1163617 RepID=S6AHI0_SULDS|nr:hypothetical protein [Sulfuricella denitrificans]BAN33959.1 hypothetical protein SCD_n00110 [Sulfuricella denitrificans skB26]
MIDFILDILVAPYHLLMGVVLGLLAAAAAWYLLPGTVDRLSVGGWLVVIGLVCGVVYSLLDEKEKES